MVANNLSVYMLNILSKAGDDFTSVAMMVTFSAGQSRASVSVPIIDDILGEMSEVFTASLSAVTGNVVIGADTTNESTTHLRGSIPLTQ